MSDASDLGWGAHIGNVQTQGMWSTPDLFLHINVKELRAIHLACTAFLTHFHGRVVRVLTDNTAAMYYINKQGGTHSLALCWEALALWEFCIAHDISLRAAHLPGVRNMQADRLSRVFSPQYEWSLLSEVTHRLFQEWGTPQIDLFATRWNQRCPQFCSRGGVGKDTILDAFLMSWSGQLLYAFPPLPLIPKVLEKVKVDKARVILIAPAWPRQHWYGPLLRLLVAPPEGTTAPSRPPLPGRRAPPPSQSGRAPPDSMAAPWLNEEESRYSEQVRRVLLESRKPSTRRTYVAKCSRFAKWSSERGVSPSAAPLQFVLDYLLSLRTQDLAPRSHIGLSLAGAGALGLLPPYDLPFPEGPSSFVPIC
ncbi:uncharacterized protein LOC112117576 [Terrapene carolina triunguis]|uniref:uncharacterized protein LOC112117576 n=1 Tax=Terrapene triunguis TaxID=2587831 RepID=UPI000E7740D3|nr:uncharacterized protein LOC112117576 [Terrapene carolina triunguis]